MKTLSRSSAQDDIFSSIQRAMDHATPGWKEVALRIIREIAETQPELTTDDVWPLIEKSPWDTHEPRALGPIMIHAAKRGWITATDRAVKSNRKECHHRKIQIWQSRLFPSS